MKYDAFVDRVAERAGLSNRTAAERSAVAVLQHLCDRLTGDEADDLLAQLPYQLKTAVIVSPSAQPCGRSEARTQGAFVCAREEIARRTATASQAAG